MKKYLFVFILFAGLFAGLCEAVFAGDPSGKDTYSDSIEGLKFSANFAWVLISAFLVFNMQVGFVFLGSGFVQKKNVLNYGAMSFIDFCIGALIFWLIGFGLMFGGSLLAPGLTRGNSFIGYSGFLLCGEAYDVSTSALWLFQVMFAATATTIVTGAIAERCKFHAHVLNSLFLCGILYPVYGHWMWGNGWLQTLPFGVGARDFAGSGVVHGVGGVIAFIAAWLMGPRYGKYNPDGSPNIIRGHNQLYIIVGTLILIFGWFGFNAGSTLAVTELRVSIIASNTFKAAAAGALTLLYISYFRLGKFDISMACNGALAGCVAITASGAYVPHWAAVVIGIIGSVITRLCLHFVENTLKIDDPVGAISVHGGSGLWGLLAIGIFADGTYGGVRGLITGSCGQLLAQFIACVTLIVWCSVVGFLFLSLLKRLIGLRESVSAERSGLDLYDHGTSCYPDTRL
ncbi:MAG: ammonium transporter [Candidatus Brocadiaceae bacterium]|nr:ammonium transporter [Candidatus Brocadiaceae bacterium]